VCNRLYRNGKNINVRKADRHSEAGAWEAKEQGTGPVYSAWQEES
jgi:hypothetical protein